MSTIFVNAGQVVTCEGAEDEVHGDVAGGQELGQALPCPVAVLRLTVEAVGGQPAACVGHTWSDWSPTR